MNSFWKKTHMKNILLLLYILIPVNRAVLMCTTFNVLSLIFFNIKNINN